MPYIPLKNVRDILDKDKSYSREFLAYLCRTNRLKAVKIGAEWMTTKEWIQEFQKKEKLSLSHKKHRLVLPLYFGWQLVVAIERIEEGAKRIFWPFRKYWQEAVVLSLLIIFTVTGFLFYQSLGIEAATFTWTQTDWSGGASTTAEALHSGDQTGWNLYYSASTTEISVGAEINLASTDASTTHTSDTDFSAGTFSNATTTGSGSGADMKLAIDPTAINWVATSSWNAPATGGGESNYPKPAFADLDADGDYDLMIGDDSGITYGYENTGATSSPSWTATSSWDIGDIGSQSNPAFADLDNDGDYDLMIGKSAGTTYGYENTGSASSPSWAAKSSWNVSIGTYNDAALADLDNDGDYDLMIGEKVGVSYAYENTGDLYYSSGNFTSSAIDTGQNSFFSSSTLDFTVTEPASTTLKFQLRSANSTTSLESATWYGPNSSTSAYYTVSTTSISSIHDGDRYIQYKAYLETSDTLQTPYLSDLTINYMSYPSSATLTSSPYDSSSDTNALGSFQWAENLSSTSTTLKLQLRTSSASSSFWSDWWGPTATDTDYFTSSATGCSTSTGAEGIEVTCTTIPSELTDTLNDRWIQYKVILETTNTAFTPTLHEVELSYVANASPEFDVTYGTNGISINVASTSQIDISYKTRDPDTDEGNPSNQWKLWPSFEYSLNGGGDWYAISTSTLIGYDQDNYFDLGPATSTWISTTTYWDAKSQISGNYSINTQIRVTIDDHEGANNTSSTVSEVFTLDTKDPIPGAAPIVVDASQSPAPLTLSATDDSSFEMKIGLEADLSGSSWESYNSTSSISLVDDPETIYVQFKDSYNNTSTIQSIITPQTPTNLTFQDTSNPETGDWREFIAWSVVDNPPAGFATYNVYLSTDGVNYNQYATNTDRLVNYIIDLNLSSTTEYYYKIITKDNDNNISYFSTVISDTPDGTGGTDLSPPSISNVATSSLVTDSVTITWNTDELSNSTVGYSINPGGFGTEQSVLSMVTSHSVSLTGLTPNTTYYFQIQSTDPSNNETTDNNGGNGFVFITNPGPVISNTSVVEITNFTAKVSWTTDIESDSYVVYSTSSDLSNSQSSGAESLITDHSVTLQNLNQGTKYYFYVKSTDVSENIAYDKNVISGIIAYYSLNTIQDNTPPTFSEISASPDSRTATIIWKTSELANSTLNYSTDQSYDTGTSSSVLTVFHAFVLDGLSPTTQYYYQVVSTDANNNTATSSGNIFETDPIEQSITGVLIVPDNSPPRIIGVKIKNITDTKADISWGTNEGAVCFVNYGEDISYSEKISVGGFLSLHEVELEELTPSTTQYFKIVCSDANSNTSRLEDTFVTLEDGAQSEEILTPPEISETSEEEIKDEDSELVLEEEKVVKEIIDFLIGLTNPNSLSSVSTILKESAAKIMSPPLIIGEQFKVEVDQTKATIMWVTDKKSNSLIAYSPEEDYNITKDEPYAIVVGNPDEKVTDHIVEILNLKPSTSYYYQIRSEPAIGPRAESEVKTLKTSSLLLEISDITFEKITESIVNLSWKTNIPARTIIAWTNLETGDEETEENPSFLRDHTFKLEELVPNIDYSLKLVTIDESGNEANSPILSFSTGEDSLAPEIYQVRSDAAISPGGEKVQTIITWLTNEFSSSQVFILEGLNSDPALAISTQVDEALIRKHTVVVPGLKPGTVYLFRVQSTDPSGNTAVSRDFTLLTPQQRKTIIQTIIQNFEETFSWMQRLGL